MSESLKIQQTNSGTTAVMKLVGQIDEDADYSGASFDKVSTTVFDFEQVTIINSTGLQKWISFLKTIPPKMAVHFDRCTPKIIKQIDMFPGFIGNRPVTITSFFAPYYCDHCSKSVNILLKPADIKQPGQAPVMACSDCQKTMEFDAVEKKYFLFLGKSP